MADKQEGDVKIPSKEELLNAIEGDGHEVVETPVEGTDETQYTELELRALEQGWKPLDKWEGDPKEHRSAREYLDRGELLGKIKSQNSQLAEIKSALAGMTEHNRKVFAAGYERALADLKAQKAHAIREGDAETVVELDDKIDETKEALRTINQPQQRQPQGPSEVTKNWLAKNEWYSKNRVMKSFANSVASDLGRNVPGISEEELYEEIDREVRKEFPEAFQKKPVQGAPSPDGEGRRSPQGGRPNQSGAALTFEKLLATMNETQASIARSLVKTGAITKEKYVEDYQRIGGQ